jgi:predicted RNA-binding Zn-ribbon protein involved in translation (DUF1610 family)
MEDQFVCPQCGEAFSREVWHCPNCDHHWPMSDYECGNCHAYKRPTQNQTEGDEPLQ